MSDMSIDIKAQEEKESLFSKKNRKLISDPLNDSNPITVQVLGICSALAITVQLQQAIMMAISVTVVVMGSNFVISVIRDLIPDRIRIIVQLVVVAALVIVVNEILKAYSPDISEKLSVFVGLIITNCIVMGRLEAFALGNKPWPSVLDGLGNGLGYSWLLIVVAIFREIFGSGSISLPGMGQVRILPDSFFEMGYMNNNMMILPPMALVIVGVIIWIQRSRNPKLIEKD